MYINEQMALCSICSLIEIMCFNSANILQGIPQHLFLLEKNFLEFVAECFFGYPILPPSSR